MAGGTGTTPPRPKDNRIHSTVFHKRDRRVNDIVRRCRKSEIISLYGIDCCMLFRVEQAHMQFDMLQNYRPYIQFDGKAEGVFLPEKTGLLFPNACDQLDFRTDVSVQVSITYSLSDLEIATLANNGLFNGDWSCQGRVIGSLLEIPCKVDYSAVANTPLTFVEIEDRLSLKTSTMKTGYKTLAAAFLPYKSQRHGEEQHPKLREGNTFDRDASDIRHRSLYDSKSVGFGDEPTTRTMAEGASFVEVAQARIQERLKAQMSSADVLGLESKSKKTAAAVTNAVNSIRSQTDSVRKKEMQASADSGRKLDRAALDARLNDMANRMVYEGAKVIPVDRPKVDTKSLAEPTKPGENDTVMTTPITDVPMPKGYDVSKPGDRNTSGSADGPNIPAPSQAASAKTSVSPETRDTIEGSGDRIQQAAYDAEKNANDIVAAVKDIQKRTMSRKERLARRRAEQHARLQQQEEAMKAAGEEEVAKGMTQRDSDVSVTSRNPKTGELETVAPEKKNLDGDIMTTDVDLDDLFEKLHLQ